MKKLIILFTGLALACQTPKEQKKQEETKEQTMDSKDFTSPVFTGGIEGPAVAKDGILYLVNFEQEGTIGQVQPNGQAGLFVTLPEGSIGNGIRFNREGAMFVADYPQHNVLKIDPETRAIEVFAHNDSMNQPNDLAIMDNGILFASDPNWQASTGQLWRISPEGETTLLEANMGTTNGIEVSSDNRTLYVNESIQRNVWAYDLDEEGKVSNKRLFHKFSDFGMDGMRCDEKGNLYVCRYDKGTVAILSPEGKLIQEIQLKGKKPSNIAFGGKEGKTCYITLQDRKLVETFEGLSAGRAWKLWHSAN
ncbi:SMP-30/gluconolactonase/LRE family protein [Rapidithrix thailandica]|uniref:SMP-30/gluconolactonase/LRE family protein n=1 Tax=Rapidithrix thailandica TaxID=413964 RepID=A0AAW9S7E7_9BACT